MKRIRYIENRLSGSSIDLNGYSISAASKEEIEGNASIFSKDGFFALTKAELQEQVYFYDEENIQMTQQEFYEYYNYMTNAFFLKDTANPFKIYQYLTPDAKSRFNNFEATPKSLNFKKELEISLVPKKTFVKGFVTECEYFVRSGYEYDSDLQISAVTYSDPIVKSKFEYHMGDDGYIYFIKEDISWQTMDNIYVTGDTKVIQRHIPKYEARNIGKQRRGNIIDLAIINTGGLILNTESGATTIQEAEQIAMPFLDYLDNDVNKYIKGNTEPLIASISGANTTTYSWLDNVINSGGTTVKEYLIDFISGGTIESNTIIK